MEGISEGFQTPKILHLHLQHYGWWAFGVCKRHDIFMRDGLYLRRTSKVNIGLHPLHSDQKVPSERKRNHKSVIDT
jgi:hypothetical protein